MRALILLTLFGCFAGAESTRSSLTYMELMQPQQNVDYVDNGQFMRQETFQPAQPFFGAITIKPFAMKTTPAVVDDRHFFEGNAQMFPGGTFQFFTLKNRLVPVERDVLDYTGGSFWKLILLPGKIWREASDQGYSRAAFPFLLVHSQDGGGMIGIATFLYNKKTVSQFRMQIVQQTSPYFIKTKDEKGNYLDSHFTAVNQVPVESYVQIMPKNLPKLRQNYTSDLLNRWPVRDLYSLGAGMKDDRALAFAALAGRYDYIGDRKYNVASSLVIDQKIYQKPCETPYGNFPFCDNVLYGTQSAAKTLVGTVLVLYFAEKYGPQILDRKIYELIPEIDQVTDGAGREQWKQVTVRHLWNMAPGFGFGAVDPQAHDMYADSDWENGLNGEFFKARTIEEHLSKMLAVPPLRFKDGNLVGPGTKYSRYRDQDPFLLTIYLQRYLQKQEGVTADLWTLYNEKILKPIGVYDAVVSRFMNAQGELQLAAYTGYFSMDALAKITTLIKDRGFHKQAGQLLNAAAMDNFLPRTDRTGDGQGWFVQTQPGVKDEVNYGQFFHLWPFRNKSGCFYQLPQMQGHGGNNIDIFPNGMVGIRTAKNNDYYDNTGWWDLDGKADLADFLSPFCHSARHHYRNLYAK